MAYYIGAILGAIFIVGLISSAIDRLLLKRWMEDPTIRIFASGVIAYVLVITLAIFGFADGGPPTITRVPLFSYLVGTGIAMAIRIRRLDKRLDREAETEAEVIARTFD